MRNTDDDRNSPLDLIEIPERIESSRIGSEHHNTLVDSSSLARIIRDVADGSKLVVVSNREPIIHESFGTGYREIRPASGMVTGLEPILRAVNGTWIAHGSGSADRRVVDRYDRVVVPKHDPKYTLRRVWLTSQEELGYYDGVANNAIWPLCHIAYARPTFSRADWETYRRVNEKFCAAVLEEVGPDPAIVFIQDYHLALLPRMLKNHRPDLTLVHFWHIPWPNSEAFRIMPWGEELLDGLLGNDLLGFHIQYHCNNFLDTVDSVIESRVDREHFRIFRGGKMTFVRPFPISVDISQIAIDSGSEAISRRAQEILHETESAEAGQTLFVGVDRLDYTKGIPERLRAFDQLLGENSDLHGKVTLLQLAAPSRSGVDKYRRLDSKVETLVDEINQKYQTARWIPIRFLRGHHDYITVLAAYQLAHTLLVTSVHDGMNLVAKEFIASRIDGDGVLLLSRYTGAARELIDAIQVNPYDVDEVASSFYAALVMNETERRERMTRMRRLVTANNIYGWGSSIFEEIRRIQPILAAERENMK